jgi:hypothetical protein
VEPEAPEPAAVTVPESPDGLTAAQQVTRDLRPDPPRRTSWDLGKRPQRLYDRDDTTTDKVF